MTIALKQASTRQGKNHRQGAILVDHVEQFTLLRRASADETKKLKEFFYGLVCHANSEQKRRISIALSRNLYTPRSILIFLGLDEIDIASPVLLFSPVISEPDLRNIISKTSMQHARVIARRDNIEVETIRCLLEKDDENETILKILNHNASIQSALPEAKKLRRTAGSKSITNITKSNFTLREIKQANNVTREARDLGQGLIALANKGNRLRSNKKPENAVTRRHSYETTGDELIIAARNGDLARVAVIIRKACKLNEKLTTEYLEKQDAGTFACLLSALNIPQFKAGRVLLLLFSVLGQSKTVFSEVMSRYETMEQQKVAEFFTALGAQFEVVEPTSKTTLQTEALSTLLQNRRRSIQNYPGRDAKKPRKSNVQLASA